MSVKCPYCISQCSAPAARIKVVRLGFFKRKSDLTTQTRFYCKICEKSFSTASFHPCYNQKKRQINPTVTQLLVSGISQRRLALVLKVNRKTVVRKLVFLGLQAYKINKLERNRYLKAHEIEFDDLETFEHTKLKPVSVTMAVEAKTRKILGFRVARMPAKGLLVKRSLKKYGYRADERKLARESLFEDLRHCVLDDALIKSDENPHYPSTVRKYFPNAIHDCYRGRRGCVTGQGELKSGGFDPLFSLNHSFAMLRANINRLFRRTWNTTKKPGYLALHIELYVLYHNQFLIK